MISLLPFCRSKGPKRPAQRFAIQIKLCVPVALFSPLLSLRDKVGNGATRCARFPCNAVSQRSNMLRSFSSFAANNNSRSYSAVFRRLLLQWLTIVRVIRRQGRKLRLSEQLGETNGCVTQPQRACRAMRRKAGDMFERSESLTAQALATNSERQATKRPKNVACDL